MGVKKFIKKSVAFVAATAMALTMVVAPVGAGATYAEGTKKDPVHVDKTAELQSDGTYKLTLESWAEGSATTTVTQSGTPLDIVLVLDQSGSMQDNGKLNSLKSAVETFVGNVEQNAKDYKVDHRIAIVGYASNENDGKSSNGTVSPGSNDSKWINTGLFVNGSLKNYETESGYYKVYSNDLDTGKTYYINNHGNMKEITYKGAEWGYYVGVLGRRWNSITPKTSANDSRNTQVYEYRDASSLTAQDYQDALVNVNDNGSVAASITTAISNIAASGATRTQYGMEMANQVFENNPITNTNRKRIVVVFTDGKPGQSGYDSTEASSAVSKAYDTKKTYGATIYTIGCYSEGEDSDKRVTNFMNYLSSNYPDAKNMSNPGNAIETKKYYQTTSNASELTKIFENLSESITTGKTDAQLSNQSIVRDIISNNFELPYNFTKGNVEAYTSDYQGNGKWATPVKMSNATININKENRTIDVSGFAYDKEYTTEKPIKDRDGLGKKFIVVISNVTATKAGMQMDTNTDKSAIYNPVEGGEDVLIKAFPQPKVDIDSTSYVLDYGKTVTTKAKDYGVSAVTKANTGKPSPYNVELKGTYGKFAINNGDLDYTPGKINWDGIDTGYVFGQKSDSKYKWEEVNFMPASSVYYEDDFGLDNNTDSNVAIVWTGSWSKDGKSQSETQSDKNSQYGWDDSYDDDNQYSNGSKHKSDQKGATATFRFTGTGVDVYSRTDKNVGKILGKIRRVEGDKTVAVKSLIVDNQSVSGDYYQIPTLSFENLPYATYEVTIKVSSVTENGKERATYYLDGIRVYNPLDVVSDKTTTEGKAYNEAGELNAQYIKVRDILISADKFASIDNEVSGTVFLDKKDSTNVIGEFKDLGPKNEVYLKSGQGIAFNIKNYSPNNNINVFVGLKAMSGNPTTAEVSAGSAKEEKNINSASDLYYVVTPDANGNVVIKNTGDNLLSITKVRITSKKVETYSLVATPALMSYVDKFDTLSSSNDKTTEDKNDTTLDKDDVTIDNSASEDKSDTSDKPNTSNDSIWNKLMNSLNKWFKR